MALARFTRSSCLVLPARLGLAATLLAFAGAAAHAQVTIDFELNAPCAFNATVPLTTEYLSQGVEFRGTSTLDGGAVLDQCGNFGMNAHSGVDFLAFNDFAQMSNGGFARDPEALLFNPPALQARIWAACASPCDFLVETYAGAALVESFTVPNVSNWTQLVTTPGLAFDRLMIDANQGVFVLDTLEFDPNVVVTYCTAKTNSLGCVPSMSSLGSPSASAPSGFQVLGSNVRNQKSGLLFYGVNGRSAIPFQGGTLCVKTPIRRTPGLHSGGTPLPAADCTGIYQIDMNAFASGALGGSPLPALQVVGTLVQCQYWGRDPGFPPPNGTTLTDALEYTVGP